MIEPAKASDGPAVLEVARGVAIFTPEEVDCIQELWGEYLAEGEKESGYSFLVYRQGAQVAGFACFGPHPLTQGVFDLYWLAVHPQAQHRGIARLLVAQVENLIARRSGRKVLIETSDLPAYAPARRFYQALGFQLEAIVRDFHAEGDDLFIYTKALPALGPASALCPVK